MISVLLTTYRRTDLAVRVLQAVERHLKGSEYFILIYDDGSPGEHLHQVKSCVDPTLILDVYNGERRGVGHGMNWGLRRSRELGAEISIVLEDDWELQKDLDIAPYVSLLEQHEQVGMVRFGYLSVGLSAEIVSLNNQLWWKLKRNGYTYVYSGHASIRHLRLHDKVGFFSEGYAPGENELDFCAKYNNAPGAPDILWPASYPHIGPFVHIGAESLADIRPGT